MELNEVLEQSNQVLKERVALLEENVKLLQKMVGLTSNEVKQWEYIRLSTVDPNELNKYGEQGWEITGTISGENRDFILLKRPKQRV